ncbi:polyphenol oxidase family protein [Leptospira sp. 201903070]|uniref:Polyphenol oxidase family protein n=1 Tax=Leptospira ainlahdjerensis TaxID=2810033 RepID=A0ABS2UE77_9LEPT|nr:polyphenol oxidase family protein [Leptospira ainlahdjerensis]MBM9578680.1 polyphenol oxidase family protein [Leptospira ainlahdjerensis]
MALSHSFPIGNGKKIRILILGKKELPNLSLDPDSQRKEISKQTGRKESSIFLLNQVHGDTILHTSEIAEFAFPAADALIGEESQKILCIKTADCMPIFFWSSSSEKFAAVHSGWKGTLAGIAEKTILECFSKNEIVDGSLFGFLGPCASGTRYEVGEDVASLFRSEYSDCLKSSLEGKSLLDLEFFLRFRLEKSRIRVNLDSSGICTMEENSDFFSHRQKDVGRNLNLIWKED